MFAPADHTTPITSEKETSADLRLMLGYVPCSMEPGSPKTALMGRAIARLELCLLR
jgi:hypothetical protein